jgi:hypothetical protein
MSVAKARSRLAVEVKRQKREGTSSQSQAIQSARRALAAEKIEAFVERTVASAPPLTFEQLSRLRGLFQATSSVGTGEGPTSPVPALQSGKKRELSG